jgi:HD-like signal output (HDOD) protein
MMNKLNILFVDDDSNIIQGLKRMLYSSKDKWNLYFALSGQQALDILKDERVDIVITDMRMPEIDGAMLLRTIRDLYPHIVRIILSGYSELETSMSASGTAHQFLAKPSSAEAIKLTIENISQMRENLNNKELYRLISSIDKLPSLPELYLRLEEEIGSQDVSMKKISEIIEQDVAMSAKMLQIVNSAFFGMTQKIVTPSQAVNLHGLEVLKSLILFVKIFSSLKVSPGVDITSFWTHSITVGRTARQIVRLWGLNNGAKDEAFTGGILHDLGKLVLLQIPGYYDDVKEKMKSEEISFHAAENALYGTTHAEAGAYLLSLWGLPVNLVTIVAYHHIPSLSLYETFSPLTAVHLADHFDGAAELDNKHIELIGNKEKIDALINNKEAVLKA